MKRLDLIELPGHIALLALDQPWLMPEHFAILAAHIRLTEEVATRREEPGIVEIARRARALMQEMETADQIAEFRRLVGPTLPWVSRQPNFEIERAAKKFLAAYD